VKYWEIIADKLKKRGWSLGWVSAVDGLPLALQLTADHDQDARVLRAAVRLQRMLSSGYS
jgi:Asp-tRNA(Asn)/Glu-tRNA(Gln) amidotransferase A subunit family amidase